MADKSILIGRYLSKPQKRSDRAKINSLYCYLENCREECPLLKKNKCIHNRILSSGCIYGKMSRENGPTQRSNKYYSFISNAEKDIKDNNLKMPETAYADYLINIGDYIYLPYAHMDLCKEISFVRHNLYLLSGIPFVKVENFTPEIIVIAAKFRPQALFGGEIKQYQSERVPLFLLHVKYLMPDHYDAAVKLDKTILEKTPSIDNIKTVVGTLDMIPIGKIDGYTINDKRQKVLSWDGITLKAECEKPLLCGYSGKNYIIEYEPVANETKIQITDDKLIFEIIKEHPEVISKESFKKGK